MKTDYLQGIIVVRPKPAAKQSSKNYMRGTLSKLASELGIRVRPKHMSIYIRPKKLSAREQNRRDSELGELLDRLRPLS